MAITLTHTEIAALRAKLGISARELCDLMGIKSVRDFPNYEADPARVKSAKPMSSTHCTLLVLIAEYHHRFKRLPPLDYLKAVNLDQKARFWMMEIPENGPVGTFSDPEDLPSAREIRAHQRRAAARKKDWPV